MADAPEHIERAETDRGKKTKNVYAPDEARQAEVILKSGTQRRIFFIGFIGTLILAAIVVILFV